VFIRQIVRNAINYAVGSDGLSIKCEQMDNDELEADINNLWDKFVKRERFVRRQKEMVERGMLDGEFFLRWFENDVLAVRFIEPETVRDPQQKHSYGIETEPDDVETALKYYVVPFGATNATPVDAAEVFHSKFLGTANMKRGIPPLAPLLNRLKQYDGWLNDRIVLNRVRSKIVLIRKWINSTEAQIKAFANAQATSTSTDDVTGQTERHRRPKAGTMLDTHGNVEYDFLAPNVQASDVRYDGREIKLSMAVGAGQPEYMVTGDASNANFSSTWIAEAPGVKEFERLQGLLKEADEDCWHRVMIFHIKRGEIPEPEGYDPDNGDSGYPPAIEAPPLVSRDRLKDTQANTLEYNAGVLSKKTWRMRDGLDDEEEQANIDAEENEDIGGFTDDRGGGLPPDEEDLEREDASGQPEA